MFGFWEFVSDICGVGYNGMRNKLIHLIHKEKIGEFTRYYYKTNFEDKILVKSYYKDKWLILKKLYDKSILEGKMVVKKVKDTKVLFNVRLKVPNNPFEIWNSQCYHNSNVDSMTNGILFLAKNPNIPKWSIDINSVKSDEIIKSIYKLMDSFECVKEIDKPICYYNCGNLYIAIFDFVLQKYNEPFALNAKIYKWLVKNGYKMCISQYIGKEDELESIPPAIIFKNKDKVGLCTPIRTFKPINDFKIMIKNKSLTEKDIKLLKKFLSDEDIEKIIKMMEKKSEL